MYKAKNLDTSDLFTYTNVILVIRDKSYFILNLL